MDSDLSRFMEVSRQGGSSTIRVELEREVNQPLKEGLGGDGFRGRVSMARRMYERYDISLIIEELFGRNALETATIEPDERVTRGGGFSAEFSRYNSARTIRCMADGAELRISIEVERDGGFWTPDLPYFDERGRKTILLTGNTALIERIAADPDFGSIIQWIRTRPANAYTPTLAEHRIDLGRPAYQPIDGNAIGVAARQGDAIILAGKLFGPETLQRAEVSYQRPRRTRVIDDSSPKANDLRAMVGGAWQDVQVSKAMEPAKRESVYLSEWNIAREFTFMVGGKKVAIVCETSFKREGPVQLPEAEAKARRTIIIRGKQIIVDGIIGRPDFQGIVEELRRRDVAEARSTVERTTIAKIPPPPSQTMRSDTAGRDCPSSYSDTRSGIRSDPRPPSQRFGERRDNFPSVPVDRSFDRGFRPPTGRGNGGQPGGDQRRDRDRRDDEKPKAGIASLVMKRPDPGRDRLGRSLGYRRPPR
jgi:hypothetical protein